jgi:hypothetical protein
MYAIATTERVQGLKDGLNDALWGPFEIYPPNQGDAQ